MNEIREFVMQQPMFETHEHLKDFAEFDEDRFQRKSDRGFRDFLSYAVADVEVAGATGDWMRDDRRFFDRWQYAATTGYGEAARLAVRKLFGLEFCYENREEINRAYWDFMEGKSAAQIYGELYRIANIRGVIVDRYQDSFKRLEIFQGAGYPPFMKQTIRFDRLMMEVPSEEMSVFEKESGVSVHTLKDFTDALRSYATKARAAGKLAAFKMALSYQRPLGFDNVSPRVAAKVWDDHRMGRKPALVPLTDYLVHFVLQMSVELGVPVQMHTGYLAGTRQDLRRADPSPLIPLFQQYDKARFDLFHAGWPHSEMFGAIGKNFPNVWLDLCWAWAMSPRQMERILYEWLGEVPYNKIFGFGGDTWTPFTMLGYAEQARRGVANVMERVVREGLYDAKTAADIARRILHDNAAEFYTDAKTD